MAVLLFAKPGGNGVGVVSRDQHMTLRTSLCKGDAREDAISDTGCKHNLDLHTNNTAHKVSEPSQPVSVPNSTAEAQQQGIVERKSKPNQPWHPWRAA